MVDADQQAGYWSRSVEFELRAQDILLVYFFTTIGINARAADLLAGGRP